MHLTRKRIADQFHKRMPAQSLRRRLASDESKTPTIERFADPGGLELEPIWNAEWSRNLLEVALDRAKRETNSKHFQLYYLHVVKNRSAREVAQTLNTNVGQVYLAKHRVSRLLKKQVKRLETQLI